VEGPSAILLTTTAEAPDPELQNRCITLRVNEQTDQTAAIHEHQRSRYTLEARQADQRCAAIRTLHQNAHRLLEPVTVVIPWADQLTFRADQTRMRRDHAKYLSMIASIALLHQFQRARKIDADGAPYIEATIEDIETAGRLAAEALGQSLDSLMPQTRQLLLLLADYVNQQAQECKVTRIEIRFTQREIREALGWGDYQLRRHLKRLIELEYVLPHNGPQRNQRFYELIYNGEGRHGETFLLGLIDTSKLLAISSDAQNDHSLDQADPRSMPLRWPRKVAQVHTATTGYVRKLSVRPKMGYRPLTKTACRNRTRALASRQPPVL
jgi:DNA primase